MKMSLSKKAQKVMFLRIRGKLFCDKRRILLHKLPAFSIYNSGAGEKWIGSDPRQFFHEYAAVVRHPPPRNDDLLEKGLRLHLGLGCYEAFMPP